MFHVEVYIFISSIFQFIIALNLHPYLKIEESKIQSVI